MTDYMAIENGEAFEPVVCPHCGHTEMLDVSIRGNWDCEECGNEFWITPMRFYSGKPLKAVKDADGNVIGYQLPLSYLALFPTDGTANNG